MGESRMYVQRVQCTGFPARWAKRSAFFVAVLAVVLGSSSSLSPTSAGPQHVAVISEFPAVFLKVTPTSIEDLQAIEDHVSALVDEVKVATVGVQVGRAYGSGVIVSSDGYVLTAGHVSGNAGRAATITLSDGRRVNARTLGQNSNADSGMLKIVGERTDWPHAEMAPADELRKGDWCAALGHPGGVQKGREAVLRLGRVLSVHRDLVQTDCELVGGDSGGPLFDMRGRVIGINSRIAERSDMNFHVPVSIYENQWDRLVAGESIVDHSGAYLGLKGQPNPAGSGLVVTEVIEATAAEEAGLLKGDVLLRFNGDDVTTLDRLKELVGARRPGSRVVLAVLRDGVATNIVAKLGEF